MEIIFTLLFITAVVFLYEPITSVLRRFNERRHYRQFRQVQTYYHSIISTHIRYYNRLSSADQEKFLFRTYLFQKARRFHFIEVQESAEKPILISAVAVQLTFGLEKYMMNYFRNIFVLKDDYHYGFYSRPFQGHVDHSGIYLSWDNFLKGIRGLSPNCNVGLHEMGHALTYVNFITQTEVDDHFKKEFRNFSKVARPIYESLQFGVKNVLGDYASTNYQEFWAVSVEVFFENPIRMRHELPELFLAMKQLLRQDPIVVVNNQRLAA